MAGLNCNTMHTTGKSIVIYRFSCAQGLVEDSALSVVVNAQADALTYQLDGEVKAHHGDDGELGSKPETSTGHHNHITFPCTSCGSASEVAVKLFLLGGALQVSLYCNPLWRTVQSKPGK